MPFHNHTVLRVIIPKDLSRNLKKKNPFLSSSPWLLALFCRLNGAIVLGGLRSNHWAQLP